MGTKGRAADTGFALAAQQFVASIAINPNSVLKAHRGGLLRGRGGRMTSALASFGRGKRYDNRWALQDWTLSI